MRHRKNVHKLGRTASHRRALLANMASALILYKKIKTTTVKAKVLRSFIERLITKARRGDLSARRTVLKHIPKKEIVKELFDEIAPKYTDRPGGYLRITKIGKRRTDAADMALIELIGFEGVYKKRIETSQEEKKKRKEKKEKEAAVTEEVTPLSEVEEKK